ncbi:hypothetical protein K458DRAFT_304176 [Lentithecium fluviatile CBS 122367]|uniref:Rhodopsin domain-containing protein n=1 Tax=Lentithecium fluviatile CBS 122367 TaxID=1168545 RepID=A0A6G1J085_9PLEO|nr:hypothetical protein K458DRAFT_304176 [Lentithecium fluviatile CBS 122367]
MADVELLHRHADKLFARDGGLVPPSSVILSWPRPNYINPDTHDWSGSVIVIVVLALSITVYTARIWARVVLAKNAGLDDLLMSVAMFPLIGVSMAVVLGCRVYGFQLHAWDQTSETYVTTRQMAWAIELTYMASTSLIKISILCFYRRLANGSVSRTFVYWVWGSIAFVIVYFVAFTMAIIFTCSPIQGYWRMFDIKWRLQNEMSCHNEGATIVSVAVVSTTQDLVICALPIFLVWNLQIPKRQKAALIAIFAMGLLTCVCGIMRTYYAIYVYYFTYDISWYAYYGWIWTALEAQLGVVCASAPALKVFFKRYFNFSSNRSGLSKSSAKKASGYGKASPANSPGNSLGFSQGASSCDSKWDAEPVPLNQIKISTGLNVVVEDRDDAASQGSSSSTRNLTALPVQRASPTESHTGWLGSRTICTSFRPESQGSRDTEHDIERGTGRV